MKSILVSIVAIIAAGASCPAQSLVRMPVAQNPLFEVSANEVNVAAGEGSSVTLGGDLVIKGGSGSYAYRWYDAAGNGLGSESTLSVSTPGIYNLDITDSCDCLQTVRFNVSNAGVSDLAYGTLRLSPNPTEGPVAVDGFEAVQIAVVNMSGRMEYLIDRQGEPIRGFNLSNLPAGQYIVTLSDSEGRVEVARIIRK